jgi:VIT1/CCC1 family predicted Fe2+/Mn2+ transporter
MVIILGFANLFADGFSMAMGNYLSTRSRIIYRKRAP